MNPAPLRIAAAACLLAAWPNHGFAQSNAPGGSVAASPTPASQVPPVIISPATQESVNHVRQLVRDIETSSDNIKSKAGFGAQLWLVQGEEFFANWVKPASPNINPVTIAPRGENINTVIIFYGFAHDSGDLSSVTYSITVHRPDGTVYSEAKDRIGWQGLAPQEARSLELGRDHVALNFGAGDPAGVYTVEVVVRDNVARVELPLKQSVVVQ